MKTTLKEFWMAQVNNQLYMLGYSFPRDHYKDYVLPKLKVDILKEFYHAFHELEMIRVFNENNAQIYSTVSTKEVDYAKLRRINTRALKKKLKLVKEILHDQT